MEKVILGEEKISDSELWCKIAIAVAGSSNVDKSVRCGQWAYKVLEDYRERFNK